MCARVLVLACVRAILCCLYVFVWERERERARTRESSRACVPVLVGVRCGVLTTAGAPGSCRSPSAWPSVRGLWSWLQKLDGHTSKAASAPGSVRQNNLTRLQERDLAAGGWEGCQSVARATPRSLSPASEGCVGCGGRRLAVGSLKTPPLCPPCALGKRPLNQECQSTLQESQRTAGEHAHHSRGICDTLIRYGMHRKSL